MLTVAELVGGFVFTRPVVRAGATVGGVVLALFNTEGRFVLTGALLGVGRVCGRAVLGCVVCGRVVVVRGAGGCAAVGCVGVGRWVRVAVGVVAVGVGAGPGVILR